MALFGSVQRERLGALLARTAIPAILIGLLLIRPAEGAGVVLQIIPELTQVKGILSEVGPVLSGILFVVAGVFYSIGQVLPPDKKAQFHTTAVNVIIGAIVLGVLSVAATSLSVASAHLLSNLTVNGSA
jgi:hypothetical protein